MKRTDAEKWTSIEAQANSAAHVAKAAKYDANRNALVLTLHSGAELAVPIANIMPLANFSPEALAKVTLEPDGTGLRWDDFDTDLLIVGLVRDATGEAQPASTWS